MAVQINQETLAFVQEAKEVFEGDPGMYTYRDGTSDENDTLIALRYGMDRDCILVYELGECVANFVQQMEPEPVPRNPVMKLAYDMEKQLKTNEHRGGWDREHWCDLAGNPERNIAELRKELIHYSQDQHEISIRCANIANYAMMIADNKGTKL